MKVERIENGIKVTEEFHECLYAGRSERQWALYRMFDRMREAADFEERRPAWERWVAVRQGSE